MYSQLLILDAIQKLQTRRPDASVLVGDLQEVLCQQGVTWRRGTVQTYLKQLADQHVLERLDRNVYRLTSKDKT